MEPIYHEGQKYISLASAVRRLGVSENEVRYLVSHGHLLHHSIGDELYVRESDVAELQKDQAKLARVLPKIDPKAMARRVPRL